MFGFPMASTLHSILKRRGLKVFLDVRLLARGLKARLPFAAARRHAEYVLIDHHRVPVGYDAVGLARMHLERLSHVREGLGYTKASETPRRGTTAPSQLVAADLRVRSPSPRRLPSETQH